MQNKKNYSIRMKRIISHKDKLITIINPTLFPDKRYLISKIQGVLRYSSERHVITKLEDHEGKEITARRIG